MGSLTSRKRNYTSSSEELGSLWAVVLPRGTRKSGHCARIDGCTPKPSPFSPEAWLAVETRAYGCGCSLQPALWGDFHTGAIIILKSLNCLPVAYFLGPCLPEMLKFNLVALMHSFSPFPLTLCLLTAPAHNNPCLTWHHSLQSLEDTAFTYMLGIK